MLYDLLKLYARLAIKIYCPKVITNDPSIFEIKGPVLLACNHPNSFLDGMIITSIFKQPVYTLARGDAFKNHFIAKFLRYIKLLPIYRTSEGLENIGSNYSTFEKCQQSFSEGNIVLIFAEGLCRNEWHLRALKKGAARLTLNAWDNNLPLSVIPVGLNYSSFRSFGKCIHLLFGQKIIQTSIPQDNTGRRMLYFNEVLKQELAPLVYELNPSESKKIKQVFSLRPHISDYLLFPPALIGLLAHAPLFYLCKLITELFFNNSDHYDSVQTSLLFILYPPYLLFCVIMALPFFHLYALLCVVCLPLLAYAASRVKILFPL